MHTRSNAIRILAASALPFLLLIGCTDDPPDVPTAFVESLPAPTNLLATPVSGDPTALDLTWDMDPGSIAGVDHYNLYNILPQSGLLILVASPGGTAYRDTALVPNFPLFYQVSAVDLTGFEGFRSEMVVGTPTVVP